MTWLKHASKTRHRPVETSLRDRMPHTAATDPSRIDAIHTYTTQAYLQGTRPPLPTLQLSSPLLEVWVTSVPLRSGHGAKERHILWMWDVLRALCMSDRVVMVTTRALGVVRPWATLRGPADPASRPMLLHTKTATCHHFPHATLNQTTSTHTHTHTHNSTASTHDHLYYHQCKYHHSMECGLPPSLRDQTRRLGATHPMGCGKTCARSACLTV